MGENDDWRAAAFAGQIFLKPFELLGPQSAEPARFYLEGSKYLVEVLTDYHNL
jgi:hypothetical protein